MKKILIALSFFTAMFLNSCIKNQIIIDDYNSDGFKVTNQMLDFKSLTDMGNYMQKSNDNQQVLLSQKSIGFNS